MQQAILNNSPKPKFEIFRKESFKSMLLIFKSNFTIFKSCNNFGFFYILSELLYIINSKRRDISSATCFNHATIARFYFLCTFEVTPSVQNRLSSSDLSMQIDTVITKIGGKITVKV